MSRAEPSLAWQLPGVTSAEQARLLLVLLARIADGATLAAAGRSVGVSYRYAWGLLATVGKGIGAPLVAAERGRGTRLTMAGLALLRATRHAEEQLAAPLAAARHAANEVLDDALDGSRPSLSICASHDLALIELRALAAPRLKIELQFLGSEASLEALARGRCELAGFHVTEDELEAGLGGLPISHSLRAGSVHVLRLVAREQGLMFRSGTRLTALGDLSTDGLRFINRQPGSGTRRLFDRLIAAAGLPATAIAGYADEEFTHLAVAATVASGRADAGFGVRAAATRHGLEFVLLATERYLLAVPDSLMRSTAIRRFLELIRSPAFARAVAALPGYALDAPGAPASASGRSA